VTELAATYVRIRPRTTGFKTEADEKLRRQKPKDVEVQVSADTRTADERLSLLKDRLDTLRLRTTETRVKLAGDDKALGRLAAIDAAMIRLDRARANPKIDLEGVAKAEAQIAGINTQLDRLDHRGGGAGGGVLSRFAAAGSGGFFGGKGLLGVAGGAAAVPLGIGAAGLGAGLLTPTVAGVAGLGLFGAASKSAFTRVGKAQEQLKAINKRIAATPQTTSHTTTAATPAQLAAAQARLSAAQQRLVAAQVSPTSSPASITSARASVLSAQSSLAGLQGRGGTTTKANAEYDKLIKQLTPAERAAAKGLDQLEDTWKHFQRALEPESFKLLATGTVIFRKGLHDLLPMTKAVGDEVDHLAKRAETALDSPFWDHFFGRFLTREAPRAVDTLGVTIGNVVTGFAHLAEQWAPLGHGLESDAVKISQRFKDWSSGQGPGAFMAIVKRDGPIVAHAVVAIARALGGLAMGLEPIGRIELQALTPILNFVGTLGRQHPAVITALGVAYLGVAGGLKAIAAVNGVQRTLDNASSASRTLGSGLKGLRRSALITAGAIGVFEIGKHAGGAGSATLGGALAGLAAGMLAFGPEGAIIGAVVGGLGALEVHFLSAQGAAKNLTDQVDALAGSLEAAIKLDKGLLGANVQAQVKQTLLTNPDFQKPGIGGLTFLQTLTKYGVSEKQIIDYASGRGESRSISNVIAAARKSGNKEFLDQFTELMESIIQALGQYKDINTFAGSGGGGGGGGGGHHGRHHSTSSSSPSPHGTSTSQITVTTPSLGTAGNQAGVAYTTGVRAGITAGASKVDTAIAKLGQRISTRLQAALQTEKQVSSSITSSLLGAVGLDALGTGTDSLGSALGTPTSAGGIITGLEAQKVSLEKLRRRLRREHKHGLSGRVEQEIAGLGLDQGGAIALSLSHANRKQLRRISSLDASLQSTARGVGRSVAHDIFGDRIDGLRSALHQVEHTLHDAVHRHRTLTDADLQHLRKIFDNALSGNPVHFNDRSHSRKQGRAVRVS
jgi:hypothetical protein